MRNNVLVLALAILSFATPVQTETPLCPGLSLIENDLTPELGTKMLAITMKSLECSLTLRADVTESCMTSLNKLISNFCTALDAHQRQTQVTG